MRTQSDLFNSFLDMPKSLSEGGYGNFELLDVSYSKQYKIFQLSLTDNEGAFILISGECSGSIDSWWYSILTRSREKVLHHDIYSVGESAFCEYGHVLEALRKSKTVED